MILYSPPPPPPPQEETRYIEDSGHQHFESPEQAAQYQLNQQGFQVASWEDVGLNSPDELTQYRDKAAELHSAELAGKNIPAQKPPRQMAGTRFSQASDITTKPQRFANSTSAGQSESASPSETVEQSNTHGRG